MNLTRRRLTVLIGVESSESEDEAFARTLFFSPFDGCIRRGVSYQPKQTGDKRRQQLNDAKRQAGIGGRGKLLPHNRNDGFTVFRLLKSPNFSCGLFRDGKAVTLQTVSKLGSSAERGDFKAINLAELSLASRKPFVKIFLNQIAFDDDVFPG